METNVIQATTAQISTFVFRFNMLREWRDNHCAGEGLNFKETVMLELIFLYDGITATGLSRFLDQTQSSTKEVLDPLVERGLVGKMETKGGRNIPLCLTPLGLQTLKNRRFCYGSVIATNILEDLSPDEIKIILSAMNIISQKVYHQFKELSSEPNVVD